MSRGRGRRSRGCVCQGGGPDQLLALFGRLVVVLRLGHKLPRPRSPPPPKSHHADAASACFASAQPCSYGRLPKCTGMCGGRQRQQLASAGRGDRRGGKVCDPESDGAGRGGRAFSPFMANSAILTLISNCRARAPRCRRCTGRSGSCCVRTGSRAGPDPALPA